MYYFGYSIIHETYVMIGCQLLNVVFSHFLYSILILQGTANKLTCQTCMATALQLHGNSMATAPKYATLFLVLRWQENMIEGGLVTARGGFHKWQNIK